MPLQLDAAPPEAYIWVKSGEGPRAPFLYIFARGHMALCAVSGQFVVPLEPPPTPSQAGPGPPEPPTWKENPLQRCTKL